MNRSGFAVPRGKPRPLGKRRPPSWMPGDMLERIIERDGHGCAYRYGGQCGGGLWTLDHVIPRSIATKHELRIGFAANDPDNLVVACLRHNAPKMNALLVPLSWRDNLPWLNGIGIGIFRVWSGRFIQFGRGRAYPVVRDGEETACPPTTR